MNVQHLQIMSTRGLPVQLIRMGPVDVHVSASGGKYPDGNYAVVRGADSSASFDMPLACCELPASALGRDMVLLSHVHEDHTAGLSLLPDARVFVHAGDAMAMQSIDGLAKHYGYRPEITKALCQRAVEDFHYVARPDAVAFEDGSVWDLGGGVRVRALHAPGHTSGHCVLMIEPHGIAFIGDIDLTGFGPYYGDATSNLAAFRRTLAFVREIDAACWITSHHRGVITDRGFFLSHLEKFGAVLQRRDDALLTRLRERPATLDELVAQRFVYPRHFDDLYVEDAERRMIGQHLEALQMQGRVEVDGAVWSLA